MNTNLGLHHFGLFGLILVWSVLFNTTANNSLSAHDLFTLSLVPLLGLSLPADVKHRHQHTPPDVHLGSSICWVKALSCFLQCVLVACVCTYGYYAACFYLKFLANMFGPYLHPYSTVHWPCTVMPLHPGPSLSYFHLCLHPRWMASAARPP